MKATTRRGKETQVYLPPTLHTKLHKLAAAAGIAGGEHALVEHIIEGLIDDAAADILIDGWNITNPATIAELYRIQSGTAEIVPFPQCQPRLIKDSQTAPR